MLRRCVFWRFYLFYPLLLLASPPSFGQDLRDVNVGLGVRGGVAFSGITIRPYQETTSRTALEGGVVCRFLNSYIGPIGFGLLLELNYATSSYGTVEYSLRPGAAENLRGVEAECTTQWFYLPMFLQVEYKIHYFCFQLAGGVYGDYLLSEQFGLKGDLLHLKTHSSYYHKFGWGVGGGGSVGVDTPYGAFMLEYRYRRRLTDLYRRQRIPAADEPRSALYAHSISVVYYYSFTLSKKGETVL